jgi:DNA-binding NarL/FixJ family response regulator
MKKILVIEDHAMMRRNIVTILEMEGYTTFAAANGREGLALVASEHPDLVICDVMMPELDGRGVLQALRADPLTASVPFIFLTAKGEKADQRSGMNLGADDYLIKPITRNDLVAALDARFARKEQQRVNFDQLFADPAPLLTLGITTREAEVLLWIVQGKGNDEIGVIIGISTQTVKKHVCAILDKLGVDNRSSASIRAMEVLLAL